MRHLALIEGGLSESGRLHPTEPASSDSSLTAIAAISAIVIAVAVCGTVPALRFGKKR